MFKEVAPQYPGIQADALLHRRARDAAWCRIPAQFEVIVTNNLFGDIITDLGAALQGGLGMAASGNIHPGRTSMFEPVHGSAPPLAGKNVANPIGAILSAALMLETSGSNDEAAAIERRCGGVVDRQRHDGHRRHARHARGGDFIAHDPEANAAKFSRQEAQP